MNGLRRGRFRLLALFLALWGAVVVLRLVQLQLADGSRYRKRAEKQQSRRVEVSARRGSVFDRQGRELAVSVEVSSVYAIPDDVKDRRGASRLLSRVLGEDARAIEARINPARPFAWVARKIDPETARRVAALSLPGIHLVAESKRFYPKGELASALLGYVGTDDRGLDGLEHRWDKVVRGTPGEIVALTDARRSRYGEESKEGRSPREGASLVLTLDSGLQYATERELAAALRETGARSGVAVLMDPKTGDVLAMASAPTFDPNDFAKYPADVRRNRAIADAYEPGSTFKIVTGAIALENGLVDPDEWIDTGHGAIQIGRTIIRESEDKDYGTLNLAGVFERSSNVGIIRIGLRLGPERLWRGASAMGVGRPTGVDLPGESPGIFRPLDRWTRLSTASISMGQEVAVTPLQLARLTAAVANGGMLVTPRVVDRILYPDGRVETNPSPPPVRLLSTETAERLRSILTGVVERGTGRLAAIPGFRVAGKTGTAQKAGQGGYLPGRHVPNFVGFAPAEDPRLVAVVVLEEPRGVRYHAAEVACPVFSRIVSQSLGILRVAPESQRVGSGLLAESRPMRMPEGLMPAALREGSSGVALPAPPEPQGDEFVPGAESGGLHPDAYGMTAREALALYARSGLPVRLEGSGVVVRQRPPAGAPVRLGEPAVLTLEDDAAPRSGREEAVAPPGRP
ncbi:MAG TPA: penicillin-binding protein [Thermoanaerobaculia bacterium]